MELISIKIDARAPAVFMPIFPANNQVGTVILARYLETALQAAGFNCPVGATGEFNLSVYAFRGPDIQSGLAIVLDVLEKIGMTPFAEVYRHDEAEQVLRRIHPAGGAPVSLGWLPDEEKSATAKTADLTNQSQSGIDWVTKLFAFLKAQPPQTPPASA